MPANILLILGALRPFDMRGIRIGMNETGIGLDGAALSIKREQAGG
jgi:hypothetical protein